MIKLLAPALLLGLFACSGDAGGFEKAIRAACLADAIAQPIAAAGLTIAAPELAPLVALDKAIVHPAITAACAEALGDPTGE